MHSAKPGNRLKAITQIVKFSLKQASVDIPYMNGSKTNFENKAGPSRIGETVKKHSFKPTWSAKI